MAEGEQRPLTNAAIARHWGCSAPYVTKLRRSIAEGGKAMPDFLTLAEADSWRAVNAPPKASSIHRSNSPSSGASAGKKIADHSDTTTGAEEGGGTDTGEGERSPANNGPDEGDNFKLSTDSSRNPSAREARERAAAELRAQGRGRGGGTPAPVIDVSKFIRRDTNFEELMIAQAEEVPQIAHGLFVLACKGGNAAEISAANRNWHETMKSAAAVRSDFIELQERTRALISIDDVRDVLGTELQAARAAFLKLGERVAAKANPADPLVAKAAIDAAVDEIFQKLEAALERGERELIQQKAS